MIAVIDRGVGRFEPLGGPHAFVDSDRLRLEQRQAVETVLASRDRAVNLQGAPGTGHRDIGRAPRAMASVGKGGGDGSRRPWTIDRERTVYALQVVLPKRTYVLPWTQLVHADGTSAEVRARFAMHDVAVTGCGLEALLEDLTTRNVTVLRQPLRVERFDAFTPATGRRVATVEVRQGANRY